MYEFAQGDIAKIVIRSSEFSKCLEILEKDECYILQNQEL